MAITRSFQWYRHATIDPTVGAVAIGAPTSAPTAYTTVAGDFGLYLHTRETASNAAGTSDPAFSNVVGPVTAVGDTYVPAAGRIAPIDKLFGDRPVPQRRMYSNELDILDVEEAGSDALHELMHAAQPSTKAVASGRWSDPAIWSNGVPGAGYTAHIPGGFDVLYDVESSVQLKYLLVHGAFRVDPTKDTKIVLDTVHGMAGSVFQIGTKDAPITQSATQGKPRFECVIIGDAPGSSTRLGLMLMGDVIIRGEEITHRADCANMAANATSTVIDAGFDISKWQVGHKILIPSRSVAGTSNADAQYTRPSNYRTWDAGYNGGFITFGTQGFAGQQYQLYFDPVFKLSHDEMRTISAIDYVTRTVSWTGGLAHAHNRLDCPRTFKDGSTPSIPARVYNLSRPVSFRSGGTLTDLQQRGHFMVMHSDRCDIRGAQFVDMARTSTDPSLMQAPMPSDNVGTYMMIANVNGTPIGDPNNVRGRYAIHLHGTGRRFDRQMAVVKNCVCTTSTATAPPQPGWAITQHNSRAAIEDNIVYNVRGAGIVSEVGTELGQWVGNGVFWARGDGGNYGYQFRNMYIENHNGHYGVAYENQARQIIQMDNECTSFNVAYAYLAQNTARKDIVRSPENDALYYFNPLVGNVGHSPFNPEDEWGRDTYGVAQAQIPRMENLIMVDGGVAMAVDERNHINRADMTPGIFKDWLCYGVGMPLRFMSYTWFYDYERLAAWGVGGGTAIEFGPKTAAFNFKDLVLDGYTSVSGNHCNSTGRWLDINTAAARGVNELDGDQSRSPAVSMEWLNSNDFAYVAPSFTLATAVRDGNVDCYTNLDWGYSFDGIDVNIYGTLTDGLGSRKWPYWTVSTAADGTFTQLGWQQGQYQNCTTPAQLVERCGAWLDNGVWKSRLFFHDVDRLTHDHFVFHVDITHENVNETRGLPVLLANQMAGPPDPPVVPVPLEDVDKPWSSGVSANVEPPFVFPAGAVKGVTAECFPGKWTGHRDHFGFSWLRGATKVGAGRKYTPVDADVGQPLTCQVDTHGTNHASLTTPAVTVVDIPTPQSIFGTAFKEMWRPDLATEITNRKGAGLSVVRHDRIGQWKGINGTVLQTQGSWKPYLDAEGWGGAPCVSYVGQRHAYAESPSDESVRSSSLWVDLNVVNPHFWLVVERSEFDQFENYGTGAEEYLLYSTLFEVKMFAPSADGAQNRIQGTSAGSSRTDFPKGKRAVIYAGRGTAGRSFSLNNTGLVSDGAGAGAAGVVNFATHHPWYAGVARYKEVARVYVDTPTITATQHAQMFAYLSKLYSVTP